ncbi:hypothetical protein BGX31_009018 [Mortierella sp. GBA43]|nr:hypothetical protein BGX31_009018 [Mortierella sp. GBA43]
MPDDCFNNILTDPNQHQHHRPLRRLSVNRLIQSEAEFNLYRDHHFRTLEEIDIFHYSNYNNAPTVQILTSCPSLRWLRSRFITAQEIIDSGPSWVCRGLEHLSVMIDMDFGDDLGPYRKFTEQEIDQCRAVFKHLANLRRLRVLDTLMGSERSYMTKPSETFHCKYMLVPLPMRLKAGLDQLRQLRDLEKVTFWSGRQATYKKEVVWMVDHWKRLKQLNGGWLVKENVIDITEDQDSRDFYYGESQQLLASHGVDMSGSLRCRYFPGDVSDVDIEDCCGEAE